MQTVKKPSQKVLGILLIRVFESRLKSSHDRLIVRIDV